MYYQCRLLMNGNMITWNWTFLQALLCLLDFQMFPKKNNTQKTHTWATWGYLSLRRHFCLWQWTLQRILSLQGRQVIQDFPFLPVNKAPSRGKRFTPCIPPTYGNQRAAIPVAVFQIYRWSIVSFCAGGSRSSRASEITLKTQTITCSQSGRVWAGGMADGFSFKWRPCTFSPLLPGEPRSPTSPWWPSGP